MIGKYLNQYKNRPLGGRHHATAPYDQRVYNYPMNNNDLQRLQGRRPDPQGGGVREPPGDAAQPFLPLALHSAARRGPAEPQSAGPLQGLNLAAPAGTADAFNNVPAAGPRI